MKDKGNAEERPPTVIGHDSESWADEENLPRPASFFLDFSY